MPFVSVTRLRLRSRRFLPGFLLYTCASARQVKRAEGFVTGVLAEDPERGNWTITVWRHEAAMRGYRGSGWHKRAMPLLMKWCDEASVAHWTQDSETMPDVEAAFEQMRALGRVSKVQHPSLRHQTGSTVGAVPPRAALALRAKRQ